MAAIKQKGNTSPTLRKKSKKKRTGIHSKKKNSSSKSSKNYFKIYRGQGK